MGYILSEQAKPTYLKEEIKMQEEIRYLEAEEIRG
jgi:hypothetical protein